MPPHTPQNITHSSDSTKEQATLHTPGTSQRRGKDNPSLLLQPRIHYCRSPNMETFTCWWHFPDNGSHSNDNITFTLTYAVGKGPKRECPDYVTGGANSCYFDSHHTQVWEIYCMNVMANSRHGNYTSEDHCLDVADIVETDPPFNLTYWLTNSSAEETGRTAVVSWLYPNDADVRMGWVTLVFELQYRRKSEPHNWKAKAVLREPRLELLELPVGTYEVRVRCKSHNSRLWSKWSDLLAVSIPPHQTIDKMLAVVLVTGIGVMAFLMIGFGVIPQGQRIKAFLLPPVPKPRIRGIDPSLLKNGRMDEITSLFRSFHGYSPPLYRTESWLAVATDEEQTSKGSPLAKVSEKAGEISPNTQRPIFPEDQRDPSPYCEVPSQALGATPVESVTLAWPSPGPPEHRAAARPKSGLHCGADSRPRLGLLRPRERGEHERRRAAGPLRVRRPPQKHAARSAGRGRGEGPAGRAQGQAEGGGGGRVVAQHRGPGGGGGGLLHHHG
ncbi:hypothetical protein SKAU_G00260070 [Synaphobranchus kaupii]|uniref:Fibronectin type-III domain-containing protein n=1 Tax=Synaphobranchus kaupii TaxID=118154 RepID=A0A9Q1F4I3_SYNKA|nr:hypothetical protein SKAU_G00260070 [Synaphobranchus kaupii]